MTSQPDRYEITSVEQMIQLYGSLPKDRGDLMLQEVTEAIRYAASVHEVLGLIGCKVDYQPITWINDTKGIKTVNFMAGEGEDPFVSFKITPSHSEDAA